MKTKLMIGLGVMTAALFLVVPNASPKHGSGGGGGGASVTVSATCMPNDSCAVSATGLTATSQYRLEVVDSSTTGCNAGPLGNIAGGDFFGSALTLPNSVTFALNDTGCTGASPSTFTFNLYLLSTGKGSFGGGTLVGSVTVVDE